MGDRQRSVMSGARRAVPAAPLAAHLARFSSCDSAALLYTDETCSARVSYAQLWARTNALARALVARAQAARAQAARAQAARTRPNFVDQDGDCPVAVCMQPTHKTVIALLACWKAGAAYLPLDPSFPQQRIDNILQDAQPTLVLYDDCCNSSMLAASGIPSVSFEELSVEAGELSDDSLDAAEPLADTHVGSVAILLYTSGSTGVPKGVRIPYSAICNRLWWQFCKFPFSETEATCVWKTALTFGDSVCEIWGPLVQGRTLLILPREVTRNPQKLVQVLAENHIQRLVLVPTLLHTILMYLSLNDLEMPLQALKFWVCSGESLSKVLAVQFFQYFGDQNGHKLANFYGSTEVMGDITYYVLENTAQLDLHNTIPIGRPMDNCEVYLLDNEMQLVNESEVGEICVAGPNLACGYVGKQVSDKFLKNPHSTSTEFGRLYSTGDFGVVQNGVILFAGRTDSQVKIRGHRVDLLEVERAVFAVDGVQNVILCFGSTMDNPVILAFVTLKPTANISLYDIDTTLKNKLVSYMLPQVIIIESIPLLLSGKIDRQKLLKMYENMNSVPDMDYSGVCSGSLEKARVLFETVGEVLGRAAKGALSVRTGFYDLGGNSLNTIITITKLRKKGYYIKISDFLEAANLGAVLSKLSTSPHCSDGGRLPQFTAEPMSHHHKQDVIKMIVDSFSRKGVLDRCLRCRISIQDYEDSTKAIWPALLHARLSIVLTDDFGTPAAVALNFDAHDDLEIKLRCSAYVKLNTFIDTIEDSVRKTMIPQGKGKVLHSCLMATANHLSARDNVAAICALEHEVVQLARDRGFLGVLATNSSPLTQQLATDVLGYQTLLDYQVNQYADTNGDRIFGDTPDHVRVLVCWKPLTRANQCKI